MTWVAHSSGVTTDIYPMRFGNCVFMGLTDISGYGDFYVVRSTDGGVTWNQVLVALKSSLTFWDWLFDLSYGNGVWLIVGGSTNTADPPLVYRSTDDGLTWTSITGLPALGNGGSYPSAGSVRYKAGTWVATVSTGGSVNVTTNYMVSTDDGLTWSLPNTFSCEYFQQNALTDDGADFINPYQSGSGTKIATSPDGSTWTAHNAPPDLGWGAGAYGATAGTPIAFGSGAYVSANGSTDTVRVASSIAGLASASDTSLGLSGYNPAWIEFGGGTFVAVDVPAYLGTGGVSVSNDGGATWTPGVLNFAGSNGALSVAYGGGRFVAAGQAGNIAISGTFVCTPTGTVDACPPDSTIPLEIYRFSYQSNFLYYTSGAETVTWMGHDYVPYPIRRDHIGSQAASIDQTLEVKAFRDFPPAQLFRVQAPSAIVNLTVFRKCQPDAGNEFAAIWIGKVLNANWVTNNEVKLQCESDLSSMRRLSLRRRYQLGCSYALYRRGCNVNPAAFAINLAAGTFSVSGRAVSIPNAGYANNHFAGGYLTYLNTLSGVTESFAIRSSAGGVLQLALTPYGLSVATALTVYPGCNHTTAVCAGTFNNLDNYGGQPLIPKLNPFSATTLF